MAGTKRPTENWFTTGLSSQWNRVVVAPGVLLTSSMIGSVAVKVPTALIGFGLEAVGSVLSNRQVRVLEERLTRQDLGRTIEHTLLVAVRLIEASQGSADRSLRANVMLLEEDQRALQVVYRSEPADDDTEMQWRKGQGCAGRVLETGKTVIGDEQLPVRLSDAERKHRPWNMSAGQVRHTAERIGSVLSVPLRLPDGRRVVGVLNFDDRKPSEESLLNRQDIIEAVELVAKGFGPYLTELGITEARD